MSEVWPWHTVAASVYSAVRSFQILVNFYTILLTLYSSFVKPYTIDVWSSSSSEKDGLKNIIVDSIFVFVIDNNKIRTFLLFKFKNLSVMHNLNSIFCHLSFEKLNRILIIFWEEFSRSGKHLNSSAKPCESLSKLTAYRTNSNDQHTLWKFCQVENVI